MVDRPVEAITCEQGKANFDRRQCGPEYGTAMPLLSDVIDPIEMNDCFDR